MGGALRGSSLRYIYIGRKGVMEKKRRTIDTVLENLKNGVQAVFASEAYKEWLATLARFHRYSLNNTLLIAMQRPDATQVASIRTWNQLGRRVRAGEHGIKILVPTPVRIRRDDNDEEEEQKLMRFKVGHVFDVSQVDALEGAPPLTLGVSELDGDIGEYDRFMDAFKRISPVPVRFDEIAGSAKGYYDPANLEIVVQTDMSPMQTAKTCLHELAHAVLHNRERMKEGGEKDRETKEVEAESVAYVCMQALLGQDSGEYSFTYIASWSGGREMPELMASLKTIHDTSAELIDRFEQELGKGASDGSTVQFGT